MKLKTTHDLTSSPNEVYFLVSNGESVPLVLTFSLKDAIRHARNVEISLAYIDSFDKAGNKVSGYVRRTTNSNFNKITVVY